MPRPTVIAIDGAVATGKTSLGKMLSKNLEYRFLDTGIMYRALTWLALEKELAIEDEARLGHLARDTVIRLKDHIDNVVLIDGQEVGDELRQPKVDRAVSLVAKVADVRVALVEQQREIAKAGGIVAVGRDVGTVVLPDADLKLFLRASVDERARRRYTELDCQGYSVEYDQVLKDLRERDKLDTSRSHSPLRPAEDAIHLDTDGLSLDQVMDNIMELVEHD